MATGAAQTYLTPQEYLTLERKALPDSEIVRSEYLNGELIAMSGASFAHNLITYNISGELRTRLRGSGCLAFANEMRVSIPSAKSYFYPDVGVVCGEPRFEDDVFDTLLNPIVVVEVLSPSTEAYDRGDKFAHYRQLQSLQEYILVSQDKVRIDHYVRHTTQWILTDFQELDQHLPLTSIQCELPLQEIYERVPFPE
ncbi:MAG: Uma2 family endonuclease [Candidatus Poribacteria bacterium]|nr:Uma2 family endonuclease [Candidatus Poribacteria bacterium]